MDQRKLDALYRISILSSPDPEPVFQEILEIIAELYGHTMAMVNVTDGQEIRFRSVVNPHPVFQADGSLTLKRTLCQFPVQLSKPLLVQNAKEHPDYRRHLVVRLKLKRYLGVPIWNPLGDSVGTLCILDDNTDQILDDEDIQFFSMLGMRVSAELEREKSIKIRISLLAEQDRQREAHLTEAIRFKAFFESTADAVISLDTAGYMTYWNQGAEKLFGYTDEEAIGQQSTLIDTDEDIESHRSMYRYNQTLRNEMEAEHKWYQTRWRHKSGENIDVSITTSPLILHGSVIGLVAIVRDFTDTVNAARTLQARNEQLDALSREQIIIADKLSELNQQLKSSAEEKRHFVNMVIHDLRHPLTTIKTTLHLLEMTHELDAKQRAEDIRSLQDRTRLLGTLLDELILYDKIETGHSILAPELIDLHEFVTSAVKQFKVNSDLAGVQLLCTVDPVLRIVHLDRRSLHHILMNLIANALKFTTKGSVSVRALLVSETEWALEVEDTGIGMSTAQKVQAFDEYFTGTNRSYEGMGLGLAIAHRLCIAIGAKVSITSIQEVGTLFKIVFPKRNTAINEPVIAADYRQCTEAQESFGEETEITIQTLDFNKLSDVQRLTLADPNQITFPRGDGFDN